MPLNTAMALMSAAEFLLWAILGFMFWTKGLHRRFPAMHSYLILRVGSMPVLLGLLFLQAQPWVRQDVFFPMYFYGYWAVYIASAVALFFICLEVFRSALSSFSGLMRLGTVVFRWATLASLIVSITTIPFSHRGVLIIPDIAYALDALGQHPRAVPAGVPLPEHECAAPFGTRQGLRHRAGLRADVGQRLYRGFVLVAQHVADVAASVSQRIPDSAHARRLGGL